MSDLHYRCLVLDHDDTAVDSTAQIHYPAHVEVMRQLRPEQEPVSLDGWFRKNFEPGIMAYLTTELGFDEDELRQEYAVWRDFNLNGAPGFFPGFIELLQEFRSRGGHIAVVSHSEVDVIERHYRSIDADETFIPDVIFGWDNDETRRKPSPWPIQQIMTQFDLDHRDILIVDDLKPGVMMAKAAGVHVAAAGWSHQIPEIRSYMAANCNTYCANVTALKSFVLNRAA
jgi:beta-phosphoglucomutase-like phosphatase (HAD superfamily)